jgi:4'-phosphopantetheinyl transferase
MHTTLGHAGVVRSEIADSAFAVMGSPACPSLMQPHWRPPPGDLKLAAGEVHVWRVGLDAPARGLASARSLSPDELRRARRFAFARDRQRYLHGRAALRRILAAYLGVEPSELRFACGPWGKPRLEQDRPADNIQFSLGHAQGLALIAVCRSRRVGVDIETVQPLGDMALVAGQFFSPSEQEVLFRLPETQQQQAFFNGWTRKEAVLKALGSGFALPPEQVEVSLAPLEPARVLSVGGDASAARNWVLSSLQPAPGYQAAIAIEATESWASHGSQLDPLYD